MATVALAASLTDSDRDCRPSRAPGPRGAMEMPPIAREPIGLRRLQGNHPLQTPARRARAAGSRRLGRETEARATHGGGLAAWDAASPALTRLAREALSKWGI